MVMQYPWFATLGECSEISDIIVKDNNYISQWVENSIFIVVHRYFEKHYGSTEFIDFTREELKDIESKSNKLWKEKDILELNKYFNNVFKLRECNGNIEIDIVYGVVNHEINALTFNALEIKNRSIQQIKSKPFLKFKSYLEELELEICAITSNDCNWYINDVDCKGKVTDTKVMVVRNDLLTIAFELGACDDEATLSHENKLNALDLMSKYNLDVPITDESNSCNMKNFKPYTAKGGSETTNLFK